MLAEECRGAINARELRERLGILACNDLANLFEYSPLSTENESSLLRDIQANMKRSVILNYAEHMTSAESDISKGVVEDIADAKIDAYRDIFSFLATSWIESAVSEAGF